jgi:hypothetical protein
MKRFNTNVCPANPALEQTPKVFQAVCVDIAANVFLRMVMKLNQQETSKTYAFYLLKNIADFLSDGMECLNSNWNFVWDETFKNFCVINKADGRSLEIHLKKLTGLKSHTPDFNMSFFPRQIVRKKMRLIKVDSLKVMPLHPGKGWSFRNLSNGVFDDSLIRSRIRTLNKKFQKSSGFGRARRDRLANARRPIPKS